MELTESQRAAVTARIDRPLMILAAAGSGKTLVLCHRILHLISQGIPAREILAVTFTRRAGQDLLRRLSLLSAGNSDLVKGVRVGTFHSFCLSILRARPSQAGLAPNFMIVTPKMQLELLEEIVKEWYVQKNANFQESSAKGQFRNEAYRLLKRLGQFRNTDNSLGGWALEKYTNHLRNANAVDFGSFIRYANNILENHPETLDTLSMKFEHILVDEFQDTDAGQFQLLQALAKRHQHVTVVGDDDEQIYSWRGATGVRNFMMFSAAFSEAAVMKIEQNYRSTGAIVAAARAVISRNQYRMEKSIRTGAPTGNLLTLCECRNEVCEAVAIAKHVSSLKEEGVKLSEMAVLYRLHRVGVELQHLLQSNGIECSIKSGHGTGDDGTIRGTGEAFADIIAVMRLIVNEEDDYACKRLLNLFSPAHSQITSFILHLQQASSLPLLQSLKTLRSHTLGIACRKELWLHSVLEFQEVKDVNNGAQVLLKVLADTKEEVQKLSMRAALKNLLQLIGTFREEARLASTEILRSSGTRSSSFDFAGIKALLQEAALFDYENTQLASAAPVETHASYKDMRKRQKREAGPSLVTSSKDSVSRLRLFLDQLAIRLHDDELGEKVSSLSDPGTLTLSTIHQAKGLEWTSVILARANDGVLPVFDTDIDERNEALEEERRLMYVALTRAKSSVLITYLMIESGQQVVPSRFLSDIPRGLQNKSVCYETYEHSHSKNQASHSHSIKRFRLKQTAKPRENI